MDGSNLVPWMTHKSAINKTSWLIHNIISQREDLPQHFIRFRTDSIVVHRVRGESLATPDRICCLQAQIKVNIHVVNVDCSISRYLVLFQLFFVVQLRPVFLFGQKVANSLELGELWVNIEHEGIDHLACKVDRLVAIHTGKRELGVFGNETLRRPIRRLSLTIDWLMEKCINDVRVPALCCL